MWCGVRNLGIFMLNLIHINRENSSKYVMTVFAFSTLPVNIARKPVNRNRIRMYPAEGPLPKALAAPFAPVAMIRCLK